MDAEPGVHDAEVDHEDTAEVSGERLEGSADEPTSTAVGALDGAAAVGAGAMQSSERDEGFLAPDDRTES